MSALRDAILRDPDDVALRLAYAQELAAQGDERGEFIRVQCALGDRVGIGDVHGLRDTQQRLLQKHLVRWLASAQPMEPYEYRFRGGFLEDLGPVRAARFLAHAAAVFAEHPVRRVTLVDVKPEHLDALIALGCLDPLTHLAVRGNLDDTAVARLVEAPWVAQLESLNVGGNKVGPNGAVALAQSPNLTRLRSLALHSNKLEDAGAGAFAGDTTLGRCQSLYLTANKVSDKGVRALAENRALRSLRTLVLGRNPIGDEGAHALAESRALVALRKLDLHGTDVSDEGARALAGSSSLVSLESVDLRGCALSAASEKLLRARFRHAGH